MAGRVPKDGWGPAPSHGQRLGQSFRRSGPRPKDCRGKVSRETRGSREAFAMRRVVPSAVFVADLATDPSGAQASR